MSGATINGAAAPNGRDASVGRTAAVVAAVVAAKRSSSRPFARFDGRFAGRFAGRFHCGDRVSACEPER